MTGIIGLRLADSGKRGNLKVGSKKCLSACKDMGSQVMKIFNTTWYQMFYPY